MIKKLSFGLIATVEVLSDGEWLLLMSVLVVVVGGVGGSHQ